MALAVALLAGCQSKQDAAIETAKKQAAATGQAQQVSDGRQEGEYDNGDGAAAGSGTDGAGGDDDGDSSG